jgi:hypothetical protein
MSDIIDGKVCVVCFRVADMPRPRVSSERRKCSECHQPIWVAKEWPGVSVKVCNHCMKYHGSKRPNAARLH